MRKISVQKSAREMERDGAKRWRGRGQAERVRRGIYTEGRGKNRERRPERLLFFIPPGPYVSVVPYFRIGVLPKRGGKNFARRLMFESPLN